jgi:hypothetical protein
MRNVLLASAVMVGFAAFATAPTFAGGPNSGPGTHNSAANSGRGPVSLGGGGRLGVGPAPMGPGQMFGPRQIIAPAHFLVTHPVCCLAPIHETPPPPPSLGDIIGGP